MDFPNLKPLHSPELLTSLKLEQLERLSTESLTRSLQPGGKGSLKVRPDGTILDGHHRIQILRQRGVDVDALPREIVEKQPTDD